VTPTQHETSPPCAAPSGVSRVDAFVERHFSARGTLRLHRNALGWDLLRAPANVALAPVFLLTRISALVLAVLRIRRAARWLAERRILLPTSVAQAVGSALHNELVGGKPTPRQERLIDDYTAVRNAISEICTTLVVLLLGFAIFRIATPGVISLAPVLSGHAVRSRAVADFPLGEGLGGLWYGMFPVELPVWTVIVVGVALAMAASLVTTFAGIVADPVQARLGIHRRRLLRLLTRIEAEGEGSPGLAGEHILARAADIGDALVSLLRIFRS
jgi:hypothetical protein